MTELEHYIQSYFGVSQEDLTFIASHFKSTQLQKGDYYLRTGQEAHQLSFVSDGLLRIYVQQNDKDITQWISNKGSFITDLSSFVFDVPARWNIQALTDTQLYTIEKKQYRQLGIDLPKWHALEKLFIAKCFAMLEDRIFSHLSLSAEERYHFFYQQNKTLFNQVPLQYIASMLGMTPETFSRIRKKALAVDKSS